MLELIGMLGGGVFRLIPVVMDFFNKKQDHKQELALLDRQVALEKQRGLNRELEIAAMTEQAVDTAWAQGLADAVKGAIPAQLTDAGSWWLNLLNGLNASVRPVITYWWCIVMYSGAKAIMIGAAWNQSTPLANFAPMLLTDFDQGIVGSIIGFWFMDRALRKDAK